MLDSEATSSANTMIWSLRMKFGHLESASADTIMLLKRQRRDASARRRGVWLGPNSVCALDLFSSPARVLMSPIALLPFVDSREWAYNTIYCWYTEGYKKAYYCYKVACRHGILEKLDT